jgi:peptidyl-prolyl cis-trans isomerase B (cyclophilin B)
MRQITQRWVVIAVVAAVVAVLAGGVVAGLRSGEGSPEAQPSPTTTGSPSADDGSAPGPGACSAPPPLPDDIGAWSRPPTPDLATGTWRATLHTNCGDIVLELYGDKAPQTVSSFVFLARHGFYQSSPCHRLVTQGIFVLQCGDPTGTGTGGPGYGYGIENAPSDGRYPRGTVAMARTADPNTNGSQFFIVYDDTRLPTAGGGYTVFGRVVAGMSIVDRIARQGTGGALGPEAPRQPISILGVEVSKQG